MTKDSSLDDRSGATQQQSADDVRDVLKSSKTIAVVGLSDDPSKVAYAVSAFLKDKGYRIIPVHPKATSALGETAYQSITAIPDSIDLVYMFRAADAAPSVVEETIKKGAKAIWMPEGVVNDDAAKTARAAGLKVVMDRCAKKEIAAGHGQ